MNEEAVKKAASLIQTRATIHIQLDSIRTEPKLSILAGKFEILLTPAQSESLKQGIIAELNRSIEDINSKLTALGMEDE